MDGRASRLDALRESITDLEGEIFAMEVEVQGIRDKLGVDPALIVGHHIHLLHEYNEVKDAARGFMGLIADARGVRQVEVEKEFGIEEGD